MDLNQFKPDYYRVSYWLKTPSYEHPDGSVGFRLAGMDRANFYDDCARIFKRAGWEVEHNYAKNRFYAKNGLSRLDFHPRSLSGVVKTELIDRIPEIIAQAKTFYMIEDGIWRYSPLYSLSTDQAHECLKSRQEEIKEWMLDKFNTKRKRKYKVFTQDEFSDLESGVVDEFVLPILSQKVKCAATVYVDCIFRQLVESGLIIVNQSMVHRLQKEELIFFVRTALKSELKDKKHGKSPN